MPADHKWFSRVLIENIIVTTMKKMDIRLPEVTPEEMELLEKGKKVLLEE